MRKEEKQFNDILEQALELQASGINPEEILAMAGNRKNELAEILAAASQFNEVKNKIVPPRELLEKIVAVTTSAEPRYNKQRVDHLPLINNKFNFLSWRIIASAGVIVIAIAVFASTQVMLSADKAILKIAKQVTAVVKNEPSAIALKATDSAKSEEVASVSKFSEVGDNETESIESIIDSLSDDSSSEEAVAFDEDADVSLLAAGSQEIDNFDQIYDEKEF